MLSPSVAALLSSASCKNTPIESGIIKSRSSDIPKHWLNTCHLLLFIVKSNGWHVVCMQAISATSWQLASHLIKVLLQKRQMVTMRLPVAERKFTLFTRFLPPHQGHPCSFLVHKRFGVVAMLHVSKLQLDILWHGENYCFRFWQGPLCHIMRKYFETRVDVLLVVVSICRVGLIKCQSLTCS